MCTVDTYVTAACINVYMITFNVYIKALACFDGDARAATLITDSSLLITDILRIALTLLTGRCYGNLAPLDVFICLFSWGGKNMFIIFFNYWRLNVSIGNQIIVS